MKRLHRSVLVIPALVATGALLGWIFASPEATAQETAVFVTDDGGGPSVFHFSMPDLRSLTRPDFERSDLPVIDQRLGLDELQKLVVETLLAGYLEQFDEQIRQKLPAGPQRFGMHGGAVEVDPQAGDGLFDIAAGGAMDGLEGLDVDIDGPAAIAIRVEAGAGGPPGEIEIPEGEEGDFAVIVDAGSPEGDVGASVMISVTTPDGQELPEEIRKKLEARAKEIAERALQRMEHGEAQGHGPIDGQLAEARIEEHRARMEELAETARALRKVKARLRDGFVAQVQGQLSAAQIDRWPGLERALVRHKTLEQGRLDGERADLFKLLGRLDLDESQRETMAGVLNDYELALHAALVQRNAFLEEANRKLDEAIGTGRYDDALDVLDRGARLRIAVREINRQYADLLASKVAPASAEQLRTKAREVFHPRIYRHTTAQKAFKQARALPDLDAEMPARIDELEAAYAAERAAIDEQLRQTVLQHQPKEPRRSIQRLRAMIEGEVIEPFRPADDPIRAAFGRRQAFDERYMEQLYGLLGPEQVEKLPPLPSAARPKPLIIQLRGPD